MRRIHDVALRRKLRKSRDAHTLCGKHRCMAPSHMLTRQSIQACLRREMPTDHEAHGQTQQSTLQKSKSTELCSRRSDGNRSTELCSRRSDGNPPWTPKQNTRRSLVSTVKLITKAGQRHAKKLVSPTNHAQRAKSSPPSSSQGVNAKRTSRRTSNSPQQHRARSIT